MEAEARRHPAPRRWSRPVPRSRSAPRWPSIGSPADVGADLDAVLADLGVSGQGGGQAAAPRRDVRREVEAPAPQAARDSSRRPLAVAGTEHRPAGAGSSSARSRASCSATPGLTPDGLVGTGPGGRIRRRDVEGLDRRPPARPSGACRCEPGGADAPVAGGQAGPSVGAGWTDVPARGCAGPSPAGSPRASSRSRTSTSGAASPSTRCCSCARSSTSPRAPGSRSTTS